MRRISCIFLLALLAASCDNEGLISGDALSESEPEAEAELPPSDTDGDGIPDDEEGRWDPGGPVDTDGDGIPDYEDLDSDNDGIPDETEALGRPYPHRDSDGDTLEDHRDLDSDNDTILDEEEGIRDQDGDGISSYLDLDSDCDSLPDRDEAGDFDLATPPVDTDGDAFPDYVDPDSDDDGLPDWWEVVHSTDPMSEDSDMDGISDLIEVGCETDPLDASGSPRSDERHFFLVPYNELGSAEPPRDPTPALDHLVLETGSMADVFFAMDSSGSMGVGLANIRMNLVDTTIPALEESLPHTWFGVGRFDDCHTCAHNMAMLQQMTDDLPTVEAALTGWSTCGGSTPYTQYLYALATGDLAPFLGWGNVTPTTWTCTPPGDIGWPCFRTGSLPIVVQFGDEDFSRAISSCSPGYNHDQAITALNSISAKYIGVNSGTARADMFIIAEGTGSMDASGSPLVIDVSLTADDIGTQIVDAVGELITGDLDVTFDLRDDPSDSVDTRSEFLDYLEASVVGGITDLEDPSIMCVGGLDVADLHDPLDGRPDSFTSVPTGTAVCFEISAKQNWTAPSSRNPASHLLEVDVVGDDHLVMDTREVFFIVPPHGTDPTDIECW